MQVELNEPLRINTIPLIDYGCWQRLYDLVMSCVQHFFFLTEFFNCHFEFSQKAALTHTPCSSVCHFPGLLAVWATQPIRAQECPVWFQAHRELYIYDPPFWFPFMWFVLFSVAFTATFFCCLVHAANKCSTFWLVPVTSGTTCAGFHTLIRMSVLCVVFRLETGGEHPFAAPIFNILAWFVPPFLTNLCAFHLFTSCTCTQ